jgi:hypothetical protein
MQFKPLLVSDVHHFSTLDVYNGYVSGFTELGVEFQTAPMHELINSFSIDFSFGLMYSKAMNVENDFSHILFVSGLSVPEWIFRSKYSKKIGLISTDDPHASKVLLDKKQYIDYYFTNEKKLEDKDNDIYYLPTATSNHLPVCNKQDVPAKYRFDVVFIGTVYKDRIAPLETICNYCQEHDLTVKIIGPLLKTPKDSIIRKYAIEGIISNDDTKLFYRGSNIVINIDRNVNWNPNEDEGNTLLTDVGEPYSVNPRIYEISGCKTIQLYVNARQEAKDLFGDGIYYCGYDSIKEGLDKIINENEDVINNKVEKCYNIVIKNHTYKHRANRLLNYIKIGEMKNVN